ALQPDVNLAAFVLRNQRQHAAWSKRNDLRGHGADEDLTPLRIAGIEAGAVDDDLAAGNRVHGINAEDFRSSSHKSRSSYDATRSLSNCSLWYNSRPEYEGTTTITSVLGNTLGLKPNQIRRIEKLYSRRIPP